MTSVLRVARTGMAAALAAGLVGLGLERARFGASDDDSASRIHAELDRRLATTAATLANLAARVGAGDDLIARAARDPSAARQLFDRAAAAIAGQDVGRTGITVYGADGAPVAWAGRVFDVPKERFAVAPSEFIAPGAIGARLVRAEPLPGGGAPRTGTAVVEQVLETVEPTLGQPGRFVMATSLAPVTVTTGYAGNATGDTDGEHALRFVIASPTGPEHSTRATGGPLATVQVSAADLAAARGAWGRHTLALALLIVGVTLWVCVGPLVEERHRLQARALVIDTAATAALIVAGVVLVLFAARTFAETNALASTMGLPLGALAALAIVVLAIDLTERLRALRVHAPREATTPPSPRVRAGLSFISGVLGAVMLAGYELLLRRIVNDSLLDVLHFSLHPLDAARLAVAFALVLLHVAAIWGAVGVVRAVAALTATPDRDPATAVWISHGGPARSDLFGWVGGALLGSILAATFFTAVRLVPLLVALTAAGGCAVALSTLSGRLSRLSQATRFGVFFLAVLVPALAMYPSLYAFAIEAKERLIAADYGPAALRQREELQRRLQRTVEQIDAFPLAEFVSSAGTTPATDRAFLVWSRTDLATYRLTSSIELYAADGTAISRFALNLPEFSTPTFRAASCAWDPPFDEASRFGSSERNVLRTSRVICERGRRLGSIVVRAMLDYRTLPFMPRESPYLESVHGEPPPAAESVIGHDVRFVLYGWSRAPLLESGTPVWTIPDSVFVRLTQSRQPFWAALDENAQRYRVHFLADRGGIYALGYPVVGPGDQVINLAELVLLAAELCIAILVVAMLMAALRGRIPATGRALLREIRSSFYRKLFLAYVAGAVVPVAVLAFAIRTYFATELRAGAEQAAQRTVTTVQRLVEDYAAIPQTGTASLNAIDDHTLDLVRRAIDEDVSLFDRGRLQATSARDLFASFVLSPRTPAEVYEAIALNRAPSYVGDQRVGSHAYRLAAAPVRAGGREGIVTVPLATRDQDIDRQIDELDRRIRAAAVLFSVLGSAIGYWLAERIADPVSRLSQATRRIARGELDARIPATSSDELRRLVEDFNQMAADLMRQRAELERTQRLEAWAEMARQVAHDIKNPLTPIQLSAEHARRVNIDSGKPLSPVLDECVNAILTQVKLLRQISAEFSSFASSPTPRPETTDVAALIHEVVEPYRTGLSGRVAIDVDAPAPPPVAVIDRTLFARALTNIIENALHAMPGGGKLTIAVFGPDGSHVVIDVTDTGVGMEPEAAQRIFEPYFSTKATGTGLGLAIAKRNIELNKGTISVTSTKGVGTTVRIALPV